MRTPLSASLTLAAAACILAGCGAKPAATNAPAANANSAKPAAAAPAPTTPTSAPGAAPAGGDQTSNLAIKNTSKWAVHHLYMSPANENEWGPDQLGTNSIAPGETFTLKNIPCDTYDIKVVDEDGDECMIKGEKFCGHEATWDLSDDELLGCEGYGEE
jgi:hypothetical protein